MEGVKFKFPDDLVAGLTGSIAAIPDALAAGLMAKINPVNGLYASIFGHLIGSWTTSSVFMTIATTSTMALATGSALENVSAGDKTSAIICISVLVGVFQLLMGLFKMQFLLRYVSNSVMRGFLTGISIQVIIIQFSEFTGDKGVQSENKLLQFIKVVSDPGHWDLFTLLVGIATILLIILISKTKFKNISFFLVLVLVGLVVYALKLESVMLIGQKYDITVGFPRLEIPDLKLIPKLIPVAFALALLGFIEGAGISHLNPNPSGKYPKVAQDLIGLGVSNVAGGMFSSIPIGASITQSTINYDVGAKSRWSNFIAGILVLMIVLFFSRVIEQLPLACLGALLIIIGFDSINKKDFVNIWQTSWKSRIVMSFSLAFTLAVSVQLAVFISVIFTFLLHVVRSSNRVKLYSLVPEKDDFKKTVLPRKIKPNDIVAIKPYGSLFFAGAFALENQLPDTKKTNHSVVLFVLNGEKEIGNTLLNVLEEFAKKLKANNSKLVLLGVSSNVYHQLKRTNVVEFIGEHNIYMHSDLMEKPLRDAWRDAEKWIKENKKD